MCWAKEKASAARKDNETECIQRGRRVRWVQWVCVCDITTYEYLCLEHKIEHSYGAGALVRHTGAYLLQFLKN